MKVIIAGGRYFNDYALLKEKCDHMLQHVKHVEVVSGKATGADSLGEEWAKEHGFSIKPFPADWNTYGKRAGYIRNKQMAEYADALIAFWDGVSAGTKMMIDLATKQGLKVVVYKYKHEPTPPPKYTSKGI